MKLRMFMAAGAAILLAGCGGADKGDPAPDASAAPSAEAAPAPPAPAAAATAGSPPSREFMVGSWGEGGDCTLAIEFKADGSMVGPFEKWEMDDKGVLTMVGNPGKMHLKVVDDKTLELSLDGSGEPRKLTRC